MTGRVAAIPPGVTMSAGGDRSAGGAPAATLLYSVKPTGAVLGGAEPAELPAPTLSDSCAAGPQGLAQGKESSARGQLAKAVLASDVGAQCAKLLER